MTMLSSGADPVRAAGISPSESRPRITLFVLNALPRCLGYQLYVTVRMCRQIIMSRLRLVPVEVGKPRSPAPVRPRDHAILSVTVHRHTVVARGHGRVGAPQRDHIEPTRVGNFLHPPNYACLVSNVMQNAIADHDVVGVVMLELRN